MSHNIVVLRGTLTKAQQIKIKRYNRMVRLLLKDMVALSKDKDIVGGDDFDFAISGLGNLPLIEMKNK